MHNREYIFSTSIVSEFCFRTYILHFDCQHFLFLILMHTFVMFLMINLLMIDVCWLLDIVVLDYLWILECWYVFVHGVVGLLKGDVGVYLLLEVFLSQFVLMVLIVFKGNLCQNFCLPKSGNFFNDLYFSSSLFYFWWWRGR